MSQEFKLQDPGEGIHEVSIVAVKVAEGDEVNEGDVLIEIETDKATVEVPSPFDGTIASIRVEEGDDAKVGDTILTYDTDGGEAAEEEEGKKEEKKGKKKSKRKKAKATEREPEKQEPSEKKSPDMEDTENTAKDAPVRASPVARRVAREQGIDLREIEGTGTDGRITADDVRGASGIEEAKREAEPESQRGEGEDVALPDFERWGEVERVPLRGIRRAVSRSMTRAWREIPHVTHHDLADITELERFRREHKERIAEKNGALTLTVLVLKAAVSVLREFPRFNASLDTGKNEIVLKNYYNIGIAVQTERGLIVPVLRDVDRKSVAELAVEMPGLVDRVRRNEFERADLEGGTFTVTNPGPVDGGTAFTPIIRPPEAAILGIGRARLDPVITGDLDEHEVTARLRLPLSFAFDHRLNDGADAGRFVARLIELLATPEKLALNA